MKLHDKHFVHFHRKLNNIERLAGTMKHRSYNLAEHSFYVMQFFSMIAETEGIPYTEKDLLLASRHDLLEAVTGDLLYPVKNLNEITKKNWEEIEEEVVKRYPTLSAYSDEALKSNFSNKELHKVLKCADILDLLLFCKEEQTMGNKSQNLNKVKEECESLLMGPYYYESVIDFTEEYTID